mgnify:CR=1 FL=1
MLSYWQLLFYIDVLVCFFVISIALLHFFMKINDIEFSQIKVSLLLVNFYQACLQRAPYSCHNGGLLFVCVCVRLSVQIILVRNIQGFHLVSNVGSQRLQNLKIWKSHYIDIEGKAWYFWSPKPKFWSKLLSNSCY